MPPVIPPPHRFDLVNSWAIPAGAIPPRWPRLPACSERFDGDSFPAGDIAYPNGTIEEFRNCFEPSFGKFKSRMRASPGNHEYISSVSAEHYFTYFGDRSGPNRLGYYSFRAGEWTVLMLNSSVPIGRNSGQFAFVRRLCSRRRPAARWRPASPFAARVSTGDPVAPDLWGVDG